MTPLQQKLDGFVHGTNDWPFEYSQQKFSKEDIKEVAEYINTIAKNSFEVFLIYSFIQRTQKLLQLVHSSINLTIVQTASGIKFPGSKFNNILYNASVKTYENMFTPNDIGQLFVRESLAKGNKILTLLEIIDLKKEGYREVAPYGKHGVFLGEDNQIIGFTCEQVYPLDKSVIANKI